MTSRSHYIEQIRHSSRQIVRELGLLANETEAKLPLSFRHVIIETDIAGSLNQIDLSEILRLDKSTVSRMVHKLAKMKLVRMTTESEDKRFKLVQLTESGRRIANSIHESAIAQVGSALAQLSETERQSVVAGLSLYERALRQTRVSAFVIKPYTGKYKTAIIELITDIQKNEFGIQITLDDQPDLKDIKRFYQTKRGNFWVSLQDGRVIGTVALIDIGNGQAALRKMFVAKEFRGKEKNVAQKLLEEVIDWCKKNDIHEIYLGTVAILRVAQRFYEKNGFQEIPKSKLPSRFPIMNVDTQFYELKL